MGVQRVRGACRRLLAARRQCRRADGRVTSPRGVQNGGRRLLKARRQCRRVGGCVDEIEGRRKEKKRGYDLSLAPITQALTYGNAASEAL